MPAISGYRGNRPTYKQITKPTKTHKQTGPITIHCAAKLSAQCNKYTGVIADVEASNDAALLLKLR